MGEIRQANFRIDQDTAEKFRRYCEEQHINQAEGFDNLMQAVFELNKARETLPDRRAELERFGALTEKMMSAYLYSLEMADSAEEKVRNSCASEFEEKDRKILELKEENRDLKKQKDELNRDCLNALRAADQAEKEAAAAEKLREAAEKTAEDKKAIADTLAVKLAEAEKKAAGYDELRENLASAMASLSEAEQRARDTLRDAEEAAKDAARTAEKEKEAAIAAVTERMQEQIRTLLEENRALKSSVESARKDVETARAAAIAELSQSHREEVAEIRKKLDERTDELMAAKERLMALRLENGELRNQLKENPAGKRQERKESPERDER